MKKVDLSIFDDVDVTYALMVATVMLAAEREALTQAVAANALGLDPQQYAERRREMVALGRLLNRRLMDAAMKERVA